MDLVFEELEWNTVASMVWPGLLTLALWVFWAGYLSVFAGGSCLTFCRMLSSSPGIPRRCQSPFPIVAPQISPDMVQSPLGGQNYLS